jgi:hypothetical protein
MEEGGPVSQEVNDQEIEETARFREFFCEPSGCGLFNSVGGEITLYVGGLRDPFCTGNGAVNVQASPMVSYFDW